MPFYHATIRPGLLPAPAREGYANDVVDVHCGVTGAPPSFVHVLVTEDADGSALPDGANAVVVGTIRAGRTGGQKAEIVDRLNDAMAQRAGVAVATVSTSTRDVQASYTMEGGEVLPEPGSPEEEAWKALGTAVQPSPARPPSPQREPRSTWPDSAGTTGRTTKSAPSRRWPSSSGSS